MMEHEYFVDDCTGWLLLKWNGVRIERAVLRPILDFYARGRSKFRVVGRVSYNSAQERSLVPTLARPAL